MLSMESSIAFSSIIFIDLTGDSANAVPHYQKLRTRVTHIWGDRKGQPNRECNGKASPWRNRLGDHGFFFFILFISSITF